MDQIHKFGFERYLLLLVLENKRYKRYNKTELINFISKFFFMHPHAYHSILLNQFWLHLFVFGSLTLCRFTLHSSIKSLHWSWRRNRSPCVAAAICGAMRLSATTVLYGHMRLWCGVVRPFVVLCSHMRLRRCAVICEDV